MNTGKALLWLQRWERVCLWKRRYDKAKRVCDTASEYIEEATLVSDAVSDPEEFGRRIREGETDDTD